MNYQEFSIPAGAVVRLLGLEVKPGLSSDARSFYINCPFCGDRKYHMCVQSRGVCRCNRCGEGLGILDLYGRVRWNTPVTAQNGKELFRRLKEDLGMDAVFTPAQIRQNDCVEYREIEPADDAGLDRAYSALLALPYLALTDQHRKNLLDRGLPEEDIVRNGYASMPAPDTWIRSHPSYDRAKEKYAENGIGSRISEYGGARMSEESIIAGMLIANDLRRKRILLKGVPGFFRIDRTWCFRAETGMIIPTRNFRHQIVGLQVRRNETSPKQPRYMTVSSKGFEDGVTVNISRAHIPLANSRLGDRGGTKVCVTEGPLKADIAASMTDNVIFIALQGVNNTKELREIALLLRKQGIEKIYNCFDMDKVTNPNVSRAGIRIRNLLGTEGIRFIPVIWDRDTALEKTRLLRRYCREHSIEWQNSDGHLSMNLARNCQKLAELGVDISCLQIGGKTVDMREWKKTSKGIDDYLYSVRRSDAARGEEQK